MQYIAPIKVGGFPPMWTQRDCTPDPETAKPFEYEGKVYWVEKVLDTTDITFDAESFNGGFSAGYDAAIAYERAHKWQPIETAPKDGTEVLLWSDAWRVSWGVVTGHFEQSRDAMLWVTSEGDFEEYDPGFDPDDETNMGPTHWLAIPAPPNS